VNLALRSTIVVALLLCRVLCLCPISEPTSGVDYWYTFEPSWQQGMLPAVKTYFDIDNVLSSSTVLDTTGLSANASTVCTGVCIVPTTRRWVCLVSISLPLCLSLYLSISPFFPHT
jgi:hypothetical protein